MSGYIVEPKVQNELKHAIAKKVKEAVSNKQIKTLMHNRQSYEFARIKIDSKWLYYNLQNDRTLTKTREFIEENNKPDDYFSEDNFFNQEQQQNYHNIIRKFVSSDMKRILEKTNDQRDPLYITSEGVMANGNTRLCCFREFDLFRDIECLVFPEDKSDDWDFIRQFVDLQDNAEDFSSAYPWYARAERIEKNIKSMNLSSPDYEEIASRMQYSGGKDAELNHDMLKLAKQFTSLGYEKYKKLSDLDQLGSDSGLQVFTTLAKLRKSNKNLEIDIKDKLTIVSFEAISEQNLGKFKSLHLAVSNIWSKPVISHEQRSWDEISSSPNVLGGETVEENNDASEEYESNPIEGKNKEERKEFTDNYLDKVFILRERATMDSLSESYKKGVKEILSKLNNLNNLSLNPDSNIEGLDKIFDELQDTLNESRLKVDQIKDSR